MQSSFTLHIFLGTVTSTLEWKIDKQIHIFCLTFNVKDKASSYAHFFPIIFFFIIIVLISIFCFGTVIHYRKKPNQYHLYIIKWLLHHQPPSWQFTCMSHKQCSKIDFLCFILFHFLDRKCRQMQWVKTILMGSSYKTGSQNRLVLWTKISNPLWFSLSKQMRTT